MFRKKRFLCLILILSFVSLVSAGAMNGEEAFNKLMDGNKRFISGKPAIKDISSDKRKELLKGQSPSAVIVTCSDSRVSPELIFDQELGDVFIIRTAGNVLDSVALGSMEYAAEHLHTPLVVFMGHEKCGAVAAAVDAKGEPEGNIGEIVKKIMPAVNKAKERGGSKEEILNNAIKENVLLSQKYAIEKSPMLKHLIESGKLKTVSSIYHLGSGEVEILSKDSKTTEHKGH
ncbi:MAG: carbonic anhydrase [Nitrospirae bacterium]|nr:carbonic anhydrase [Nitrospirota bacterium]